MNVTILGGGASGLVAAICAAQAGAQVHLYERGARVGRKILASGNGRCNLSNTDIAPAHYNGDAAFISAALEAAPTAQVLRFFHDLGLMTTVEDGRIYPRTYQAASVLDVLRFACARYGVNLYTDKQAVAITPSRKGGFSVSFTDGESRHTQKLICAMGGKAAPHLGTDGAGNALLKALGHRVTPLSPALVQVRCKHPALKALKGIRIQGILSLFAHAQDTHALAREEGEILFTDYGVSGMPVFQLSRFIGDLPATASALLRIDLLPELTAEAFAARLAHFGSESAHQLLTGALPRLLSKAVLDAAAIPDVPCHALSAKQTANLETLLHAFPLPVTGTQGFAQAQVTAGGIDTDDISPHTFASRLYPDLYITGEALNVDGRCGGYNLHFAWLSGLLAGQNAAKEEEFSHDSHQ